MPYFFESFETEVFSEKNKDDNFEISDIYEESPDGIIDKLFQGSSDNNSDNIFTKNTYNLAETNNTIESADDLMSNIADMKNQLTLINGDKEDTIPEVICPIIFKGEIPVGY